MSPSQIEILKNELRKLHSKRDKKFILLMALSFFIPFTLGMITQFVFTSVSWLTWIVVIIAFGSQVFLGIYKELIYAPLALIDKIQQMELFEIASKTDKEYVLILRPRNPSAFSMSAEREGGTGSSGTGVPHPLSQPPSIYKHGWSMYSKLEQLINKDLYFMCLGDLHHVHSEIPLSKTIFLNSKYEHWEMAIEHLIKNASAVIYVPDISSGMITELNIIMSEDVINKSLFHFPLSTNPNRNQKKLNKGWQDVSLLLSEKGVKMPDNLESIQGEFLFISSNTMKYVDINKFLIYRDTQKGTTKRVLNTLIEKKLIDTTHFNEIYQNVLYRKILSEHPPLTSSPASS